jgi:type I restriction enzyme S subunit
MSFPRYPKYKASGVEWLGEVPEGWEVKPLRSVFKFSKGLTITKENLQDEGVNCVNYGEIHSKYGFRLNPAIHPLRCVSPEYLSSNPEALIRDGDFVFADTSEDLEGSGNFTHLRSDNPIFAGYHTIIARPRKGTCSLLLAYQIHSSVFRSQIQSQVKGVKVFSISQGILKGAKCWLPPLSEQTAIAEFLDRETGKIDGLVAEQRRLMELLKEKRQAVISHAVTKGLNPHAPMKPSGIEWLGDVPAGWEIGPIKYFVLPKNGAIKTGPFGSHLTSSDMQAGPIKVYNQRTVIDGDFDSGDNYISEDKFTELVNFETFPGDLLITTRGTIGRAAILPKDAERGILHPCLLRLQPNTAIINTEFLKALIQESELMKTQLNYLSNATTIEVIYSYTIASVIIPVPPLTEQSAIMQFLTDETSKFDALTAEAQRAIDLLQERRTALISAAVTGQIDVRQQI